ncbi:MAG: phosphate/phosphite/phosphonate ABC transporter substrate-binding protein [Chloroflexi bacterium]|nr:MAG: phosphate/phosphite/phosphonate ABC transporter substrate-binding protein [Chloroflexota bacterium]
MAPRLSAFLLFLLWTFLLAACVNPDRAVAYIDLSRRQPLPAIAAAEVIPLRLAVAAIISPQGTAESYAELANYLGEKLHRPVQLIQRRTYAEVNDLVAEQDVDLAFVCTSAYIDGSNESGMQLLVAPEINGHIEYHSALIVPAGSSAETLADLRGRVFAFTDPMSFSGRVYPTYLVQEMGEDPEDFFSKTFFTYSHDRAIQAVAAGVADGAAVDSLVLEYAFKRKPEMKDQLRIIHLSPPFGIPPVVVPSGLPARQKTLLYETLLQMDGDSRGSEILNHLGIGRFVHITDSAYDEARRLTNLVESNQ